MVKESSAQVVSDSSKEAPESTTLNRSPSSFSITNPPLTSTSESLPDQIAEPSDTANRTKMREELLNHLLSFSHALSDEMSIYLDHLFFRGKKFADHMAAKYAYNLDASIIEKYMAEAKEIAEKHGYSTKVSTRSI